LGYGFADEHVNRVLVEARQENPSLGVFFVHPDGRDAIHQGIRPQDRVLKQYKSLLAYLSCIGESRRPLSSTFKDDELEFEKLMRLFNPARPPRQRLQQLDSGFRQRYPMDQFGLHVLGGYRPHLVDEVDFIPRGESHFLGAGGGEDGEFQCPALMPFRPRSAGTKPSPCGYL
jgi:hypothetical protein